MRRKRSFIFVFIFVFCLTITYLGAGASTQAAERDTRDLYQIEETEPETESETKSEVIPSEEDEIDRSKFSEYLTGAGVTMIGDSIMSGNRQIILEQLPDAHIDAKGSRDVCGGFEAAKRLEQEGKLSDVVIVELGTNGPLLNYEPYASGTQDLLNLLGTDRQIFWVTVYCSYSQWMDMNNQYIWELSEKYPNITVIDWYSLSIAHTEWFPDGVHPNLEGARNFAIMLREALEAKYGEKSDQENNDQENE